MIFFSRRKDQDWDSFLWIPQQNIYNSEGGGELKPFTRRPDRSWNLPEELQVNGVPYVVCILIEIRLNMREKEWERVKEKEKWRSTNEAKEGNQTLFKTESFCPSKLVCSLNASEITPFWKKICAPRDRIVSCTRVQVSLSFLKV